MNTMAIKSMRKAIEKMYIGKCDVIEHQKITDSVTKKTAFVESTTILGQPCRISFKSIPVTSDGNTSTVSQEIKLFISPDVNIKMGSKIIITQNGVTESYTNSSASAVYETHQEITLKLFERWA